MNKIKKGDDIIVISGKDKGRRGTVMKMLGDSRVLVENINIIKKHQKPNPHAGEPGGIVQKEMPIHISNIAIFNTMTNRPDRVGFRFLEDGRKVRFFKSNNEVIDA